MNVIYLLIPNGEKWLKRFIGNIEHFLIYMTTNSTIFRDMIRSDSFIKWNEIVGHSNARSILTESTILPLQYPELFCSVGNGWKCTLLHGPPGEYKQKKNKRT